MVQVNQSPKIVIRVKFKKVGNLKYISHLDLVRTMHKVIVRADLPLWYTEGFNPKPKMVFAAPLSIGTDSVCEFMDLRLTEKIDPEIVKEKLNKNMTSEMQVTEAYYPDSKFTELAWLSYTILIKTASPSKALAERCRDVLCGESVEVLKKTKSGEKTVDIRPLIKSANAELDGEMIKISAILSADPSSFLNPEYIITALKESCAILSSPDLTSEYYSIMRECAYKEDLSEFK